jgi:hypothetical protein
MGFKAWKKTGGLNEVKSIAQFGKVSLPTTHALLMGKFWRPAAHILHSFMFVVCCFFLADGHAP